MQSLSAKTKGQEGKLLLVNSDLGTMEAIELIKDQSKNTQNLTGFTPGGVK
jgi:hypothetical protein